MTAWYKLLSVVPFLALLATAGVFFYFSRDEATKDNIWRYGAELTCNITSVDGTLWTVQYGENERTIYVAYDAWSSLPRPVLLENGEHTAGDTVDCRLNPVDPHSIILVWHQSNSVYLWVFGFLSGIALIPYLTSFFWWAGDYIFMYTPNPLRQGYRKVKMRKMNVPNTL